MASATPTTPAAFKTTTEQQADAKSAVFVKSALPEGLLSRDHVVRGPSVELCRTAGIAGVLDMMPTLGYQASNFGKAVAIVEAMLEGRTVGLTVRQVDAQQPQQQEEQQQQQLPPTPPQLPPVIFVGVVANLFGTSVREALAFLCKHALIDIMVVSGGGLEHDIRRAVEGESYVVSEGDYLSRGDGATDGASNHTTTTTRPEQQQHYAQFGNVSYPTNSNAFHTLMTKLVTHITKEQWEKHQRQMELERKHLASNKQPRRYDEDIVCDWIMSPSEFWRRVGELLPSYIPLHQAQTTVLYWAAQRGIPIFSPSMTDGDVMNYIQRSCRHDGNSDEATGNSGGSSDKGEEAPLRPPLWARYPAAALRKVIPNLSKATVTSYTTASTFELQFDLIRDISTLNRTAIWAKRSGMIILGGGVVKHHVCNANLFRNGADYGVYINNAQEFDGSDGGARPDEAVSWGKIKATAKPVKIYSEITAAFPLLVAKTFSRLVREQQAARLQEVQQP